MIASPPPRGGRRRRKGTDGARITKSPAPDPRGTVPVVRAPPAARILGREATPAPPDAYEPQA